MTTSAFLSDAVWTAGSKSEKRIRQVALVVFGVLLITLCAKIKVPVWPSPVPITLGTFAILSIGAAYGPRLGLVTISAYLIIGALGFDVFSNSSAEKNGLSYMMGGTGGYLLGYVLSAVALGVFANLGWDRNVWKLAMAMLIGNVLIYVPGLLWLHQFASDWTQTLSWGLWPFLVGDAMKLALASLLMPVAWSVIKPANT